MELILLEVWEDKKCFCNDTLQITWYSTQVISCYEKSSEQLAAGDFS